MLSFSKLWPIVVGIVTVGLITFIATDIAFSKWFGKPSIKVPAEVKGAAGTLITIEPEQSTGDVCWYSVDGQSFLSHGSKGIVIVYPAQGRYKLLAWSAAHGTPTEAAVVNVVIGDPPPGPNPPPPPGPPGPLDTVVGKAIAASYKLDVTVNKEARKTLLAAVYRQSATVLAKDQSIKTAIALHETLHTAIQAALNDDLKSIRQAIAVVADAQLPTSSTAPLDDAARNKISDFFLQVAAALEAVQ
jgi:hypothetical protein